MKKILITFALVVLVSCSSVERTPALSTIESVPFVMETNDYFFEKDPELLMFNLDENGQIVFKNFVIGSGDIGHLYIFNQNLEDHLYKELVFSHYCFSKNNAAFSWADIENIDMLELLKYVGIPVYVTTNTTFSFNYLDSVHGNVNVSFKKSNTLTGYSVSNVIYNETAMTVNNIVDEKKTYYPSNVRTGLLEDGCILTDALKVLGSPNKVIGNNVFEWCLQTRQSVRASVDLGLNGAISFESVLNNWEIDEDEVSLGDGFALWKESAPFNSNWLLLNDLCFVIGRKSRDRLVLFNEKGYEIKSYYFKKVNWTSKSFVNLQGMDLYDLLSMVGFPSEVNISNGTSLLYRNDHCKYTVNLAKNSSVLGYCVSTVFIED